MYAELMPVDVGDMVLLTKKHMLVGRKGHCDVVIPFQQVSSEHCELFMENDHWYVRDLNSTNGTRVNGARVVGGTKKRLDPGDTIAIARYTYEIKYKIGV